MQLDLLFGHLNRGTLVDEITGQLAELLDAVQATGKAGAVTIKIDMAMDGNERDRLKIGAEVKATIPRPTMGKTSAFVTQSGNVVFDDPKQLPLGDLRTVNVAEKPVGESPVKKASIKAVD